MNEQLATVEQVRSRVIDLAIKFGPKLLTALLIIIAGVLVSRAIGRWLDRGLRHVEMEPPVRILMVRVGRLLVIGMFAILALQNLGVELLPLIAGLGVAGAGIALAMQGVLSNVVMLNFSYDVPVKTATPACPAGTAGALFTGL